VIPVAVTVNGTGVSRPIVPDIFQNPFNIGVGVVANQPLVGTTTIGAWQVEHTFDRRAVVDPLWDGTTGVTWIPNSGLNATALASATTSSAATGTYAFAVAAIRLNILSTNATSIVSMPLIQSTEAP
jgi:hypothetical protein